jgi:hypothetical protein
MLVLVASENEMTNAVRCGTSQVPGIPLGTKLVRIGRPRDDEFVIGGSGTIIEGGRSSSQWKNWPIIVPDNVYNVIDLEKVPIPVGWHRKEFDWFRRPVLPRPNSWVDEYNRFGEHYLLPALLLEVMRADESFSLTGDVRRIIVEPDDPKVRRVLVVECREPAGWTPPAVVTVTFHGEILPALSWRIEERPL